MTHKKRFSSRRIAKLLLVAAPVLAVAAAPTPATAQNPSAIDAVWEPVATDDTALGLQPDDAIVSSIFGTADVDIATISWMRFFPVSSSDGYGFGGSPTLTRHATGTDRRLWAEIGSGEVPNGALITQIVFYARDNHASDASGSLCQFNLRSGTGTGYIGSCDSIGSTSGTPGETLFFANISETVRRHYHDGSDLRAASYGLLFWPGTATDQIDIRMARVLWRRQISPAPASATFNDVPTSHLFFQHIEALVDSGITTGCGSGKYCPDAPVTRGQMAAFFAKALGLHWPAF